MRNITPPKLRTKGTYFDLDVDLVAAIKVVAARESNRRGGKVSQNIIVTGALLEGTHWKELLEVYTKIRQVNPEFVDALVKPDEVVTQ